MIPDNVFEAIWISTNEDGMANVLLKDEKGDEYSSYISASQLSDNGLFLNDYFSVETFVTLKFKLLKRKTIEEIRKDYEELKEILEDAEKDDD
ncbi:MAG: hypothetical protein EKK64_01770 [Neisseriaceae bacterium]|nr:MAG: hypothetical protein EKK64_01770 [Neisseriaceae bacterium]